VRRLFFVLTVLVIAGAGAAAVQMRGQAADVAPRDAAVLAGVRAAGGHFALSELSGAPVALVIVRSAACGLCVERMRALAAHVRAYDREGARVVVATLDPPEIVAAAAADAGLDATLVSVEPQVLEAWGLLDSGAALPRPGEFLLAADGSVLFAHRGSNAADYIGDVELLGVLRRYLAERAAEP
jgi:peroxiredoxin